MRALALSFALVSTIAFAQADGGAAPPAAAPAAAPAVTSAAAPTTAPTAAPAETPAAAPAETPTAAPSAEVPAEAPAPEASLTAEPPQGDAMADPLGSPCAGATDALLQGPIVLGYQEADLATGRRVCPRTEVGLGTRLTAIIDTPGFYGNLGVQAIVFGSWAYDEKTELFGTLEAVDYQYVQNATLIGSSAALGNLTLGGTRRLWVKSGFFGAVTARLLLPTTFGTPGSRPLGIEAGHDTSWYPKGWLEVHSFVGADVSVGLGSSGALPRGGGVLLIGAQVLPFDWLAVVVDLTGRLDSARSFLAPSLALRFAVKKLSIELGATLPIAGDDRHDVIGGLRLAWRL